MKIDEKKPGSLTKREAVLLTLLAVFGFGAVMIMLVILPGIGAIQDNRQLLGELETNRISIQNLMLSQDLLVERLEEAEEQHIEFINMFVAHNTHSAEIGRMLVQLGEAHNLENIDQRLDTPSNFQAANNIYFMTVTMNFRGLYQDMLSLLNTVEASDYLRISRVNFSQPAQGYMIDRIAIIFEVTLFDGYIPEPQTDNEEN